MPLHIFLISDMNIFLIDTIKERKYVNQGIKKQL